MGRVYTTSDFLREREAVLAYHQSGGDVCLDEAVERHADLPQAERFHLALRAAAAQQRTLLQPRAGVPTPNAQRELLEHLRDHGEADLLTLTIDSYTRQHDFARATAGLLEAERLGTTDTLNGFPALSVGMNGCQQVIVDLGCPVQVRHGHPDARLLAEVTLAAGCTAFEGGGITYCVPYSRSYSIRDSLCHWRYVDRLCGEYASRGIVIERESFGALTGMLVPPSIAIACAVLELLLAAEQGVRSFSLGYAQCGELVQDVAALRALASVAQAYVSQTGANVALSTVFYQWMGPFPHEYERAAAIIALAAGTAAVAKPTRMIVKSPQEAYGVPDKDANAFGLRLSRAVIDCFGSSALGSADAIDEEQHWIEVEARCLLDAVLDVASGTSLIDAIADAFRRGTLDVPFAPSEDVLGRVATGRDAQRAVRYADFGNLPFSQEVRQRNDDKLHRRLSEPAVLSGPMETLSSMASLLEAAREAG